MNNEAPFVPDRLFAKACHPETSNQNCSWSVSKEPSEGSVEFRRVDPPAAPDERDKALARELIGNVNSYVEEHTGELSISAFGPLSQRIAAALATVRAEAGRAALTHAIKIVKEQPSTIGDWMTQSDVAANLRRKIVWALESARNGKVEG